MLPKLDHLRDLAGDADAFERERSRLITEYIMSLPDKQRKLAYAMQIEIDLARETMSSDELLKWMCAQATEKLANIDDLFLAIKHQLIPLPSTPQSQPSAP